MVDVAVDSVRKVAYAITSRGCLSAFYLGPTGADTNLFLTSFNVFDAAKAHLSHSRNLPEGSPKPELFTRTVSAGFVVVSLSVLPLTESKKVHLAVVLANGIRIYLSLLTHHRTLFVQVPIPHTGIGTGGGGGGGGYSRLGAAAGPGGIEVAYVRSPPSPSALKAAASCSGGGGGGAGHGGATAAAAAEGPDVENGSMPSFMPSQALRVSGALYAQGVMLVALDKQQHPDELACMYEDLVCRSSVSMGIAPSYQPPSMREGISVCLDESRNGSKIYDVKESCAPIHSSESAKLRTLFAQSATPPQQQIREASHHRDTSMQAQARQPAVVASNQPLSWLGGASSGSGSSSRSRDASITPASPVPVWHGASAMAMAARPAVSGYDEWDLDQVALLGETCWQHMPCSTLSLQRQFLVLTNQGLHTLSKVRPSDILYRQLVQINSRTDEQCRFFFSFYGPLEASAMCVALACGLPCDAGGASAPLLAPAGIRAAPPAMLPLETIQKRAISIMLALTQGPSYKGVISGATAAAMKDSRLVLDASHHEFVKSSAHDALYLVCSRILRPVWLRAVVQSNKSLSVVWTAQLVAEIRNPLTQLQKVLRGFFAAAVMDAQQLDYIADLEDDVPGDKMTRRILDRAKQNVNAEKSLQQQAKSLENSSINALYRMVMRSIQALSFIETLADLNKKWNISIQWSKLGEISFRSLVVSPKCQENVKKLIMTLINDVKNSSQFDIVDQVIEVLSRECSYYFSVGDRCTYEASRLIDTIQKMKNSLTPAAATDRHAEQVHSMSVRCVQLLLTASQFWRSVESVSGEQSELWTKCAALLELGAAGRDGVVDLCLAAAENFMGGGGVGASSGSGGGTRRFDQFAFGAGGGDAAADDASNWEFHLHQQSLSLGAVERAAGAEACYVCLVQHILTVGTEVRRLGAGIVRSSSSSATIGDAAAAIASGSVADDASTSGSQDSIESAQFHMQQMISRASARCKDSAFYAMLGDRIASKDSPHQSQLLCVRSAFIEDYLRTKDTDMLYSYYHKHDNFLEATNLMSMLARDEESDVHIAARIHCLELAVASAEKALAQSRTTAEGQIISENLSELKDTLDVAVYQQLAHSQLAEEFDSYQYTTPANRMRFSDTQRRPLDLLERAVEHVKLKLLTISELFHEICLPYKLWEVCLLLLHVSKHEDIDMMTRLWRSLIYRLVPEEASTDEGTAFLQLKRDISRIDIDTRHQKRNVVFEKAADWLPDLAVKVVRLGQQLNGVDSKAGAGGGATGHQHQLLHHSQSIAAFPASVILEELEEIAATLYICNGSGTNGKLPLSMSSSSIGGGAAADGTSEGADRGFSARCFYDIGFSHGVLVELFVELFGRWAGKAPEKLLQILSSTTFVLLRWTRSAVDQQLDVLRSAGRGAVAASSSSGGGGVGGIGLGIGSARQQLLQAVRSGRINGWIEKLRRHLSSLGARNVSPACADLLNTISREVNEVKRRVSELSAA